MALPSSETPAALMRQLAQALRHRVDELEALLDMLPVGIAIAEDADCHQVRFNRAFATMLGTPSELRLLPLETWHRRAQFLRENHEIPTDALPLRRAVREGREITRTEIDLQRADGSHLALFMHAMPLFDDGHRVRGAVMVAVDVTERRRVEREQRFVAEASRVLSSSLEYEETFSALAALAVPTIGDYCAIDVLREDGTVARVAFAVGDPAKEALARALHRYPPVLHVESDATRVIRTGTPLVIERCGEDALARAAQNPEHAALLRAFAVRSFVMAPLRARGRTLGLFTIGAFGTARTLGARDLPVVTDIASRAALALDNALLYQHAQDANRVKDEFLATLSHELRTPLNALLGWAQLLRQQAPDAAGAQRAIESIERNAQAQLVLIDDLLDVSRVVSGNLRLNPAIVDVAAVVRAAVDAVRPAARARGLDLAVSVAPLHLEVTADADRLQQVVWNLVANAVKFTPADGRVDVLVEEPGSVVQITVRDTGIGIDGSFIPYVFDRFRQADSSTTRAHSGLGLGLAIVRHLVELHGGTVTAESDGLGHGATFVVTLPARVPQQAGDPAPVPVEDSPLREVRVVALDGDSHSRESTVVALQRAGAEVAAVASALAALETIERFHPDVVVADFAGAPVDGSAFLRQIQDRCPGRPTPPVVAVMEKARAGEGSRASRHPFARHLARPVPADLLVKTIAELARSH
ncbi:MAG TPA: ATP-binding protein [Vicinamibacterales bacterium]|nr:ATP-binding protein [Vicinamibacterales bacterium]